MATTSIIPLHIRAGHSIAESLFNRTQYAINPDKTKDGEYVSAYECNPNIADKEFLYNRQRYLEKTGRRRNYTSGKLHSVLAYQIRQSFKPGEVTPEEANQIGYEFARRLLKGKHAFFVATHIDKKHIHNHIIWDATALDAKRKFHNFYNSTAVVRRLSDQICIEHGLSIVENPGKVGTKHYGEWEGPRRKQDNRDIVRQAIDAVLAAKPKDFDDFLHQMELAGFSVKRGKYITFCSDLFQRNIRMKSLGGGYTEDDVRTAIRMHALQEKKPEQVADRSFRPSLLIDIQAKLREGKGKGYANWAKHFNLTQMAQAVLYIKEHNIERFEDLASDADAAASQVSHLREEIRETERRMKEVSRQKTQIIRYAKTRKVYADYRASGYSRTFYAEHEAEIETHKKAKQFFDTIRENGTGKTPSVKELSEEYRLLSEKKNAAYATLRPLQAEQKDLAIYRRVLEEMLQGGEASNLSPERAEEKLRR